LEQPSGREGNAVSNHAGGYLLNEVIEILDKAKVFDLLGKERSQDLILQITHRACREYDCNAYEILEGYEARLGICHCCTSPAEKIKRGLCPTCRKATSR
jgi:hypothetical protein